MTRGRSLPRATLAACCAAAALAACSPRDVGGADSAANAHSSGTEAHRTVAAVAPDAPDAPGAPGALDTVAPGNAAAAPASPATPLRTGIPLCAGLTIVTAVERPEGDYESIKTVVDASDRETRLAYSAQVPTDHGSLRNYRVKRTVLREDLSTATLYMHYFNPRGPVTIPGSTALGTSTAVLRTLESAGAAELRIVAAGNSGYPADSTSHPSVYDYAEPYTLRRVESDPVPVRVTVNDAAVALPAVHARGSYLGDAAEFYFLDDERNPLALAYRFGAGGAEGAESSEYQALRVVKIAYRCGGPASSPTTDRIERLERALREQRRAVVYDIYFDFNEAAIRDESEPTLAEIAEVMRRNPDWRLSIEGHTDAVASDAYNLELSAHRAVAVKAALGERFGVGGDRLTTAGFGESRPRDRNDTVEGRAHNRRVELVRL